LHYVPESVHDSRQIAGQAIEKSSKFYSVRETKGGREAQKMCFPKGALFGSIFD